LLDDAMSGANLVVPALWLLEMANTLLTLLRRQRIDREGYTLARADLQTLSPIIDEEGSRLALTAIADLAEEYRLTVYDAAYLELALRRQLPLASRDSALNQAAAKCGIEVLV